MYDFKTSWELIWFVLVAVVAALAQIVQGAPPDDPKLWLTSAVIAVTRAVVGALLSFKSAPEVTGP